MATSETPDIAIDDSVPSGDQWTAHTVLRLLALLTKQIGSRSIIHLTMRDSTKRRIRESLVECPEEFTHTMYLDPRVPADEIRALVEGGTWAILNPATGTIIV